MFVVLYQLLWAIVRMDLHFVFVFLMEILDHYETFGILFRMDSVQIVTQQLFYFPAMQMANSLVAGSLKALLVQVFVTYNLRKTF